MLFVKIYNLSLLYYMSLNDLAFALQKTNKQTNITHLPATEGLWFVF